MGFYFINICLLKGAKRDKEEVVALSDAADANTAFTELACDAF